jgi:hypothetical protein
LYVLLYIFLYFADAIPALFKKTIRDISLPKEHGVVEGERETG